MRVLQKKIGTYAFKTCFCPLRCTNRAQGEPKVFAWIVYGSGEKCLYCTQQHKLMIAHNRMNDRNQQPQDSHHSGLGHFLQVKLRKDLFRQSVLPRLQRTDKKHSLSASCSQLRPQNEGAFSERVCCQNSKHR